MKVVKVTSKGQVTIPVAVREALGIGENTYLEVVTEGDEIHLRKLHRIRPLSDEDPIWEMIGSVEGGASDVADEHDRYLAEAQLDPCRESS